MPCAQKHFVAMKSTDMKSRYWAQTGQDISYNSWVGIGEGRVRKSVCCVGMSVRVLVIYTLWDCSAYNIICIRAQFLPKLKASLGGSYARFEAMSSLDKSSNELWEEHFESLQALVKAYIIDLWEDMAMLSVLNSAVLTLQLGILGKLLGLMGRIVKGCVREVSLAHAGKLYTDVCLCCSAHTSGCVVDGLGATAAF